MLTEITGLHHITSLASDPAGNNQFFTQGLGLRRIKKTVNFDAPEVYHLYYGDEVGTPGSVMTYFPFPDCAPGQPGTGEVGETVFAVPEGALPFWHDRLAAHGARDFKQEDRFGDAHLSFRNPDGEAFALVAAADDTRRPWTSVVAQDHAIRGFHSARLRLSDGGATAELLQFMGYQKTDTQGALTRYVLAKGTHATVLDVETRPEMPPAREGAGSVHHIAFAVKDRAAQADVRRALLDAGYAVTPMIDRDYFWAIYFRTPGGVLFEIATHEPGFDRDEAPEQLGQALKLPRQHEHLRDMLEQRLPPIS